MEKRTITAGRWPLDLLEAVEAAAAASGVTRTEWLQEAARLRLAVKAVSPPIEPTKPDGRVDLPPSPTRSDTGAAG